MWESVTSPRDCLHSLVKFGVNPNASFSATTAGRHLAPHGGDCPTADPQSLTGVCVCVLGGWGGLSVQVWLEAPNPGYCWDAMGVVFASVFESVTPFFPGAAVSTPPPRLGVQNGGPWLSLMFSKAGKAASFKWHSGSRWRMVLISRVSIRGNYALIDPFGIKMSPNTCSHIGKWRYYFYSSTQVCVLWEIINSKLSGCKEPDGWYIYIFCTVDIFKINILSPTQRTQNLAFISTQVW